MRSQKMTLKKTLVVFLTLGAALIFFVLAFVMGQNRGSFLVRSDVYKSVFSEAQGIFIGSQVNLHGVRTGNVLRTLLLKDGRVEISYTSSKKHRFIINASTVSRLKYQGALGDRYISLSTSDLSQPPLSHGSVIPSAPSVSLLDWFSQTGELKTSIDSFLPELSRFIASLNKEGVSVNWSRLASLENRDRVENILSSLESILKKADSGHGTLGALIHNRALYDRLVTVLGGRRPGAYLKELSEKSRNPK